MKSKDELVDLLSTLSPAATKIVTEVVKSTGPISRSAIAETTGLSLAAVTKTVVPLMDAGLLIELDPERTAAAPGRPVLPLELVADLLAFVGVKITADAVFAAMTDFGGNDITEPVVEELDNTDLRTVVAATRAAVERLQHEAPGATARMVGVGVAVSGDVDAAHGVVRESPLLRWHGIDLREALQDELELPVLVENDVRALMYHEHWFGDGRGASSMALVTLGAGIGSSLLVGGEVVSGSHGVAGELGHLTLGPSDRICHCGRTGCIEAVAGYDGIVETWRRNGGDPTGSIDDAMAAAAAGAGAAIEAFDEAGRVIGLGVAALVNLFGPDMVLITGEGVLAADLYLPTLTAAFAKHAFGAADATPLMVSVKGFDAWARSAAAIVIRALVLKQAELRPVPRALNAL